MPHEMLSPCAWGGRNGKRLRSLGSNSKRCLPWRRDQTVDGRGLNPIDVPQVQQKPADRLNGSWPWISLHGVKTCDVPVTPWSGFHLPDED